LFDRNLRKFAVFVESVKYVSFRDLLGGEVADKEPRIRRELIPLPVCYKSSLFFKKLFIYSVDFRGPP